MTRFSPAEILAVFFTQADYCQSLGSPFMARALVMVRDLLASSDSPFAKAVLNWPGDPRTNADSVPLRVMGGLHALVLSGRDPALAAAYPPHGDKALATALSAAIMTHADFLIDWIKQAPQTNETARQSPLVATACLLAERFQMPLHLIELGASAGLNLRWDRTAVETPLGRLGNDGAAITLSPEWQGSLPRGRGFTIASARGVDLNPLDATDPDQALRLLAYLWPDQPDRLVRARKAIELANENPIKVAKADAIDWLATILPDRPDSGLTLIYHTVAWQYFPQKQQQKGKALIEATGATATRKNPLAWLSMEADDGPKGAALCLRLWPGDLTILLGRADFHARWVDWDAPSVLPQS